MNGVVIKTTNSFGRSEYRVLLNGFGAEFRFAHLLSILPAKKDFQIAAYLELHAAGTLTNSQIFVNDKKLNEMHPETRRYDLSSQMEQWLRNNTEKIRIKVYKRYCMQHLDQFLIRTGIH
ncbi:unnamed protein product [Gongylonema pulchrum]|uniref:HNH endonuclease n=1 Tax=Gongylonema pulchrum TaxID=637853 RepID=A0A183ENH2_9BILA|nr:unnamed protein product [Gongylonema pulchrum]